MMSYYFYCKFERQGRWCFCDCVSSPLILVEKSVVKQQYWGDKNNIHEEWNVFPFELVNSLLYTWTFIKSKFLRI